MVKPIHGVDKIREETHQIWKPVSWEVNLPWYHWILSVNIPHISTPSSFKACALFCTHITVPQHIPPFSPTSSSWGPPHKEHSRILFMTSSSRLSFWHGHGESNSKHRAAHILLTSLPESHTAMNPKRLDCEFYLLRGVQTKWLLRGFSKEKNSIISFNPILQKGNLLSKTVTHPKLWPCQNWEFGASCFKFMSLCTPSGNAAYEPFQRGTKSRSHLCRSFCFFPIYLWWTQNHLLAIHNPSHYWVVFCFCFCFPIFFPAASLHRLFSPANLSYPLGPEQPYLILLLNLNLIWLPLSES